MSTIFLATWDQPGGIAIREAYRQHQAGLDILTCIECGLAVAELDPDLIAIGLGSVPNSDGDIELDAAMMDGKTLDAGAVCAVRGICPVISVARKVMEDSPCVMIAGEQARRFAIEKGFPPIVTHTADSIQRHQEWADSKEKVTNYVHVTSDPSGQLHGDTITMLALQDGHLVAASSTSGMPFKVPGRVGDSPIVGAGIYADNEAGAAGATGYGEELWKAAASSKTVEAMRHGASAQDACNQTIDFMIRRQPKATDIPCVVFAISPTGDFGAASTKEDFPLWSCVDGVFKLHHYSFRRA